MNDINKPLGALAGEIHENAVLHGWWETERPLPEILALIHSEVSEALEEYRDKNPMLYFPCNAGGLCLLEKDEPVNCGSRILDPENPTALCSIQSKKPCGVAVELADVIIRVLDWCGHEGIDIDAVVAAKMEYNKGRPYRHGGKLV